MIESASPASKQTSGIVAACFVSINDGSRVRSRTVQDVSATDKQRAIDRERTAEYRLKQNTAALTNDRTLITGHCCANQTTRRVIGEH